MNILLRWRYWIRPTVLVVYIALLLIVLPFLIIEFQVKIFQVSSSLIV